jgi:hypothetical protein
MLGAPAVAPGLWARARRAECALAIATGPLLTTALARRYGGAGWRTEWPAVWCLGSVAHCLMLLAIDRLYGVGPPPAPRGGTAAGPGGRPRRAAAAGASKRRAAAAAAAQD